MKPVQKKRQLEKSKTPQNRGIKPTKHRYVSTACHHKKHDLCRRWCKYCGAWRIYER